MNLRGTITKVRVMLLALTLAGMSACFGRIDDDKGRRLQNLGAVGFDLLPRLPTVLVFGAGWCKPCRHEIGALNELGRRYDGRLQIVGVLVEGEERGSVPDASALAVFSTAAGERPAYPLLGDEGWTLFSKLSAADGRTLPLIVFADEDGFVRAMAQRSLDFTTELLPMVDSLVDVSLEPQLPVPPPKTDPQDTRWTSIAEWSAVHGGDVVASRSLESAWSTGLATWGFQEEELAFADGSVRLRATSNGEWVDQAKWISDAGCTLTVVLDRAGNVVSSSGICR